MDRNPKPRVCRQLFPSDEQEKETYQKALEERLNKHLEEQKKKWNFDVATEKMIDENGTYIWTEGDGERYDWIGRPNTAGEETIPKRKSGNCDKESETKVMENGEVKDNVKSLST